LLNDRICNIKNVKYIPYICTGVLKLKGYDCMSCVCCRGLRQTGPGGKSLLRDQDGFTDEWVPHWDANSRRLVIATWTTELWQLHKAQSVSPGAWRHR